MSGGREYQFKSSRISQAALKSSRPSFMSPTKSSKRKTIATEKLQGNTTMAMRGESGSSKKKVVSKRNVEPKK